MYRGGALGKFSQLKNLATRLLQDGGRRALSMFLFGSVQTDRQENGAGLRLTREGQVEPPENQQGYELASKAGFRAIRKWRLNLRVIYIGQYHHADERNEGDM